ncbi:MAG TPA: cytochrome b/b6 domain-containing protein [Opitutaceae bacterium]
MKKLLIWDLPTRFFHWAFSAAVSLTFVFALAFDDDSPLFPLHMLFGLVAAFLLVLRLIMGVLGSHHSRFVNFPLNPRAAIAYFGGLLTGQARRYAGHNPGSALATVAMLGLVPVAVLTGAIGGGERFEDLHEVAAYTLLAAIGAHLLGLILHTLRHRENIAFAMVDGRKIAEPRDAIRSSHPLWGAAFAVVALTWSVALFSNRDPQAGTVRLPVMGTVIQLGENEGEGDGQEGKEFADHRDRDDDHEDR